MAGIRDVAKRAHVSTSTVSLVLNNNGYVSKETRSKVVKAMKELNYVPNELARNLYHSKTNIIGIILPDIAHPFLAHLQNMPKESCISTAIPLCFAARGKRKMGKKSILIC